LKQRRVKDETQKPYVVPWLLKLPTVTYRVELVLEGCAVLVFPGDPVSARAASFKLLYLQQRPRFYTTACYVCFKDFYIGFNTDLYHRFKFTYLLAPLAAKPTLELPVQNAHKFTIKKRKEIHCLFNLSECYFIDNIYAQINIDFSF